VVLVARKLGVGKSTIYRYLKDNKLTLSGNPSTRSYRDVVPSLATVESSFAGTTAATAPAFRQKVSSDPGQLVDLNYLLEIYAGDGHSVASMIDIFLQTMDRHLSLLKKYQSEQDVAGVLRCLQEMKPVVEYMGMHQLKSFVVQSRMMIDTNMEWGVIANSLSEVYSLFARCAEELREKRRELA
jgi:uncharacterized protein with HEPN domain